MRQDSERNQAVGRVNLLVARPDLALRGLQHCARLAPALLEQPSLVSEGDRFVHVVMTH